MTPSKTNQLMSLPFVAERLFEQPLMIHPRKLKAVLDVVIPRMGLDVPAEIAGAADDDFLSNGKGERCSDPAMRSIAILPVHGTLVQRGGYVGYSGMTSYDAIQCMFREAIEDPTVEGVLLDIDSGGGEVSGCFDLMDEIYAARGEKPIIAFANEHAYSAAYAIASACDALYLPRTGGVGSIGVVAVHMDQSGWNEKEGLKFTPVYAGAHKIDYWPHAPLSDEAKAGCQESIDRTYKIFTSSVARNRGLDEQAVIGTEANCFDAEPAVKAGLADGIASFDEVIEIMLSEIEGEQNSGRGSFGNSTGLHAGSNTTLEEGEAMFRRRAIRQAGATDPADNEAADDQEEEIIDDENEEAEEDPENEDMESEDEEAAEGEDPDDAAEEDEDMEEDESDTVSRADAAGIVQACAQFGRPEMATRFLKEGYTPAEARSELRSMRNKSVKSKSKGNAVSSRQSALGSQGESEVMRDMKARVATMNAKKGKGAPTHA